MIAAAVAVGLSIAGLHGAEGEQPMSSRTGLSALACSLVLLDPDTLRVSGLKMYVEPTVMSVSGTDILLAGTPNLLWLNTHPDSATVVDDTAIGAIIPKAGPVRLVRTPLPGRSVTGIRADAHSQSGWNIVFLETKSGVDPSESAIHGLWSGHYDGFEWRRLERIPIPGLETVLGFGASNLLSLDDSLWWAVRALDPDGRPSVLLLSRRDDGWNAERIADTDVAYLHLTRSDASAPHLLVTRALFPEEASGRLDDVNSLLLYVRDSAWRPARRLLRGGSEPVHWPSVRESRYGTVLTWYSIRENAGHQREARTTLLDRMQRNGAHFEVLDGDIEFMAPPIEVAGRLLWIIGRYHAVSRTPLLRFVTARTGQTFEVGSIENPFRRLFAAVVTSDDEFLLAGPLRERTNPWRPLVTVLLRVRLYCPEGRSQ